MPSGKRNESGVVTESMFAMSGAVGYAVAESLYSAYVNATSDARTGAPSCHRARGSRVNAIESESGDQRQLFAAIERFLLGAQQRRALFEASRRRG